MAGKGNRFLGIKLLLDTNIAPDVSGKAQTLLETFTDSVAQLQNNFFVILANSCLKLFENESALAEKIRTLFLSKIGIEVSIGSAESLFALKLATENNCLIQAGKTKDFLKSLPISVLPEKQVVATLDALNIKTLGEFANLDEISVIDSLGAPGHFCYNLANAKDSDFKFERSKARYEVSHTFEMGISTVEEALFSSRYLVIELVEQLKCDGFCANQIHITLGFENGKYLTKLWFSYEILNPDSILNRLRYQLESLKATAPLNFVSFLVTNPQTIGSQQNSFAQFFGDKQKQTENSIEKLLCITPEIYISSIKPERHPREMAILRSATSPMPSGSHQKNNLPKYWPNSLPKPFPSVLFKDPIPINLCDLNGKTVTITQRGMFENEPYLIIFNSTKQYKILAFSGIWPCEKNWWDKNNYQRKAFLQITTENKEAFLVFCENHQWMLEGIF